MKKHALWLLAGVIFVNGVCYAGSVLADEGTDEESEKTEKKEDKEEIRVGISIPDIQNADSAAVAQYLSQKLEEMGYDVDLRFAWGEDDQQSQDLKKWVEEDINLIVLEAEDTKAIIDELEEAKEKNIPIIALQNLLEDTDAISCFITYDYMKAGEQIGSYVKEKENLDKLSSEDAKTIEFIFDEETSEEEYLYYLGIMEELQPYLESGSLICKSENTDYVSLSQEEKEAEEAGTTRIESVLEEYYEEELPDIICAVSDAKAEEAIIAMNTEKEGKEETKTVIRSSSLLNPQEKDEKEEKMEENYPLITGGGASVSGMNHILSGEQALTFYKSPQKIALLCADTIDSLLQDEEDKKVKFVYQYDNGMTAVKSVLEEVDLVDKDNYQELLIDTGVYSIEQQVEKN